jgi:protocatechuate 3,4-dioxygenase beta subunit
MDTGLQSDLELIARQRLARRRQALALLLSGGASLLAGRALAAAPRCEPAPRETAGPFPADGSNSVRGSTVNVLDRSGIVRGDIRGSFGSSATVASGVPFELVVTLTDARRGCAPLAGHALYVWHADRAGEYSLYQGAALAENYLRGVQFADARGQVRFRTIYPSCYGGRYPHIHFEVYAPRADGGIDTARRLLTSQIVMPAQHSAAVYARAEGYGRSRENFASMNAATDGVFRDNGAAQLALMTPAVSGDVATGYTGSLTIGVAG